MQEIFSPIEGFSRYEVSNLGTIVNLSTKRVMKSTRHTLRGYYVVGLVKNGKQYILNVDKLVAAAFLDSPTETHSSILHRDGDRANNAAYNLVWMPRWFVVCYMKEIIVPSAHRVRPFESVDTGEVFQTIAEFASLNLSLPSNIQKALWRGDGSVRQFGRYGELRYL